MRPTQSSPAQRFTRPTRRSSFYAATKKANEAMGHAWAHINQLPITLFRFFTVYGPWGRPDIAPFKFTRGILEGRPIDVYNHGKMWRDFTYVGDLVRGIRLLMDAVPGGPETAVEGDSLSPVAPYRIVNIGNSSKVRLEDFIEAIERATGKQGCSGVFAANHNGNEPPLAVLYAQLEEKFQERRRELREGVGR